MEQMHGRALAVVGMLIAVALGGCGVPSFGPSAAVVPPVEPRSEVLAYFAADTPAIAVIATDPDSAAMRGVLAGLERARLTERLRRLGRRHGLVPEQLRPLLGNDLAIGIPYRGGPPLAVLVAADAGALQTLAASRLGGGRARLAGEYRGADLYAGRGHAYAIRDRVLLVGRDTGELRRALDRRAGGGSLEEDDLRAPLPRGTRKPLVRALIDAGARIGPRSRAVPWLAAWESLGLTVSADAHGATVDLRLHTSAEELVESDVPVSPGARAPLAISVRAPSVTVRDLAHVAGVVQRALAQAAPIGALRLELALRTLRRHVRVDLGRAVIARLHGPATVIRTRNHLMLRARTSHPRPLRRALDRLARGLPAALRRARLQGWDVRRHRRGLHELTRDGETVARFGMVGDVLVAGTAQPRRLVRLANAPLARPAGAAGATTISIPARDVARYTRRRLGLPLPWRLDAWLRGAPEELRGSARLRW